MADEVWYTPSLCKIEVVMIRDLSARQGATPRELVLEACRRNNTNLLQEVIDNFHKKSPKTAEDDLAQLLNTARDGIGQGVLHVAAANGHCMWHIDSYVLYN
jgi:hypothetical protein